jgi:hypothetical protein
MEEKPKTRNQERAYHKLFAQISNHCIEHGIDQKTIMDKLKSYEIQTSPQFVKGVWKVMLKGIANKDSTVDMTREEVQQVYEEFNKFWSELTGEHFVFPNWQDMLLNQLDEKL